MIELLGDSARGTEFAFVRLSVEGERIVAAEAPGLARPLEGLTLLEAAAVAGETLAVTREIRESDGRGRHTTTARELHLLPGGGLLIDTPGMRELGLYDDAEGVGVAYADVAQLAGECRFRDCAHRTEPGCAVAAAIDDGRLDPARFTAWRKLQSEARRQLLRVDARARAAERARLRSLHRAFRDQPNRLR